MNVYAGACDPIKEFSKVIPGDFQILRFGIMIKGYVIFMIGLDNTDIVS